MKQKGRRPQRTPNGSTPTGPPLVSIVISNFNGRLLLRSCLLSLGASNYPNQEVVVVDAGSADGSPEMVRMEFPSVHLMEVGARGLAECNNIGVRRSFGDLVLVDLNNDDIVDPNWLTELVKAFLSSRQVGGVSGKRMVSGSKGIVDSAGGRISLWNGDTPAICGFQPESSVPKVPFKAEYLPLVLTSRRIYEAVGGCDEAYYMYYEDTDLSYQIRRSGLELVVVPAAAFSHRGGSTLGRSSYRSYYLQRRNKLRFVLKNFPLHYAISASLYCIFFTTLMDSLLSMGPIRWMARGLAPSRTLFFDRRRDHTIAVGQLQAIAWNFRNLRETFRSRASTAQRASLTRSLVSSWSGGGRDRRIA
jgi:GT2 family glycosyltransferase